MEPKQEAVRERVAVAVRTAATVRTALEVPLDRALRQPAFRGQHQESMRAPVAEEVAGILAVARAAIRRQILWEQQEVAVVPIMEIPQQTDQARRQATAPTHFVVRTVMVAPRRQLAPKAQSLSRTTRLQHWDAHRIISVLLDIGVSTKRLQPSSLIFQEMGIQGLLRVGRHG